MAAAGLTARLDGRPTSVSALWGPFARAALTLTTGSATSKTGNRSPTLFTSRMLMAPTMSPAEPQGGLYWREGVKRISEEVFQRILGDAGGGLSAALPGQDPYATVMDSSAQYPSLALREAVDRYAVEAAHVVVQGLWPGSLVRIQPHNNPGYDMLVGTSEFPERHIEVKGTTLPFPRFFLSEGERQFAQAMARTYTLLVIHSIDLQALTHQVFRWDGAISDEGFALAPRQWACEPRDVTACPPSDET